MDWHLKMALCVATGLAVGACQVSHEVAVQQSDRVSQEMSVQAEAGEPETFDSPEAAAAALKEAAGQADHAAMHKIFGPAIKDLVTGDAVQDKNNYEVFAKRIGEKMRVEMKGENSAVLHLGNQDWTFAIPLAKNAEGKWYFDTVAGRAEVLAQHVGQNELDAIDLMNAYVQAQREYASKDRDGDEVLQYAQRLMSRPGKKDGLYWESKDGEQSPFGPLTAEAGLEGYGPVSGSRTNPTPYHGYYFHILKAQGPHAPGGAYNYVINGNMIAGFGLVASPAEYGKSGVMTFIVSHQGKVYQKDLGKDTRTAFLAMQTYDPGPGWELVK